MKQDQPSKRLIAVVLAALFLVALLSLGFLTRSSTPQTATVQFFSNTPQGYACFLNYTAPPFGAPVCMSDDPTTTFPANMTVPLGNYSIVFFPFGTASNKSTWYGTNNIHVTGWAPYDASSSYANVTITGNGALIVVVLPENGVAIPEFSGITVVTFSALAASLYLLRRRRSK
jgi:hypothetical protein